MTHDTQGRDESVGARPIGAPAKRRGPLAGLIPAGRLLLGVIILLLLLSRCGNDSSDSTAAAPTPAAAGAVTSAAPAETSTDTAGSTGAASAAGGAQGTVIAEGKTVLPLANPSGDLSAYSGQTATSTSVKVQSVPADEGFWVGSSAQDRVWIQLTGAAGESPFTVKAGDSVAFTGTVVKNPDGFAEQAGVTSDEGASMLESQGYHIAVSRSALKLAS